MKETPMLFSADMVSALINGQKTMTRRIVKPMPRIAADLMSIDLRSLYKSSPDLIKSPFGLAGDLLWVRERFRYSQPFGPESLNYAYMDGVTGVAVDSDICVKICDYKKWRPSIHMPRVAARIWLKVTSVNIERISDISEEDCLAEGVNKWENPINKNILTFKDYSIPESSPGDIGWSTELMSFITLWESINGLDSWDLDPWVWVLEFEVVSKDGYIDFDKRK